MPIAITQGTDFPSAKHPSGIRLCDQLGEVGAKMILYLEFLIDSLLMQISLPDEKIKKLNKQAGSLLRRKEFSLRSLA